MNEDTVTEDQLAAQQRLITLQVRERELDARDGANVAELVAKLAEAQGNFGEVRKDKTANAGRYSYAYASLDNLTRAVAPALAAAGIAWGQDTLEVAEGYVGVETWLRYGTAELRLARVVLPAGEDAQGVGSALTYARRYSLGTALGIAAEEDDDGAAAKGSPPAPSGDRPAPTAKGSKKATETQMKRLHALARERGVTHEQMRDWGGRHLGIETLTELTVQGAAEMEKSLRELPVLPPEEQLLEPEEFVKQLTATEEGSTDDDAGR